MALCGVRMENRGRIRANLWAEAWPIRLWGRSPRTRMELTAVELYDLQRSRPKVVDMAAAVQLVCCQLAAMLNRRANHVPRSQACTSWVTRRAQWLTPWANMAHRVDSRAHWGVASAARQGCGRVHVEHRVSTQQGHAVNGHAGPARGQQRCG